MFVRICFGALVRIDGCMLECVIIHVCVLGWEWVCFLLGISARMCMRLHVCVCTCIFIGVGRFGICKGIEKMK